MDKTMKSARELFEKRYGARLEIKWTSESKHHLDYCKSWQTTFVYSRTRRQVSFPLFNDKQDLKAIAIASPVDNTDAVLFEEMSDFLKLTIAEQIKLLEKKELAEQIELAFNKAHQRFKNVIPLPRRRSEQVEKVLIKNEESRKSDNRPLYLYGTDQSLINNISVAAHDWSKNWAYINAKELPDLIWQDKDQWKDFPQITIHIPNAETLSAEQQKTLLQNLEALKSQKEGQPLIILTGQQKIELLNPQLASLFKSYKPSDVLSVKSQAHFLMFHFQNKESWTYKCAINKGLFFYPFSKSPKQLH